jgi:dTDP-4-dehydrorhamnose reductase
MRILVIGAGQTGAKLASLARGSYDTHITYHSHPTTVEGVAIHQLDKTSRLQLTRLMDEINPDVVVDTATLQSTDYIEIHQAEAEAIFVAGTRYLIDECNNRGSLLVNVSTDYVFSGESGSYSEADIPDPINVYGGLKLKGEQLIQSECENYLIVRQSLIFSWDKNLLGKTGGRMPSFPMWLINELEHGKPVDVVSDQFSSPTLADDLCELILGLIAKKARGLFHTSGSSKASKYELAMTVAAAFGFDRSMVRPADSSSIGFRARRPRDCSLKVEKVTQELGRRPLGITEAVSCLMDRARKDGFQR